MGDEGGATSLYETVLKGGIGSVLNIGVETTCMQEGRGGGRASCACSSAS